MRIAAAILVAVAVAGGPIVAQEKKPVPKDSVRVSIPGCTKGYIFTATARTQDEPGSTEVPEGMHMRMNVAKKLMTEIKAHQGSLIELTGVMKKDDLRPAGVSLGGGFRVMPGPTPGGGAGISTPPTSIESQVVIDVESWRQLSGGCPH